LVFNGPLTDFLGSVRDSRAVYGDSGKKRSREEKFAMARALTPARETRAPPRL